MCTRNLPGADLVKQGLVDLCAGVESVAALLVSIGAPRLRVLGHAVPAPMADAEVRLYQLLATTHGDGAHSQFNALVRRLVSYQRAHANAGVTVRGA